MIVDWLVLAIVLAASVVAGLKWLRVAQREHYLARGVVGAYSRWNKTRAVNNLLAAASLLALVAFWARQAPAWVVGAGGVAWGIFPSGLPINGTTSKLAWTGRLRRLAVIYTGLVIAGAGIGAIAGLGNAAAGLLVVSIVGLPIALATASPIETRLSRRFVDEATASLRRIEPAVVAITGSYGKTSTKEYARHLIVGSRQVVASPASFNNRLGLARAVNEHVSADTEVFLAEMGTYGPGEIAKMGRWVRPNIAVMTAIGPVHLERFFSEERIVAAKSEILIGVDVAIFNIDDSRLALVADTAVVDRVVRCSATDVNADVAVLDRGDRVEVFRDGRSLGMADHPGVFLTNLACAAAVAFEVGVSGPDVVGRLGTVQRPAHRQTVSVGEGGFVIIDDTFNSNPAGAEAALDKLAAVEGAGRRVVVTPGMIELGPRQPGENEAFAARAAEVASDVIIVGRTNRAFLRKGTKGGTASVIVMANRQEAVEWVRANLGPGDAVLYENDLPDHYP